MEGNAWDENWIEGLSDLGLSERASILSFKDNKLFVHDSLVPYEYLGRVFKATYTTKHFPAFGTNCFRYEIWVGSDRLTYVEWADGREEFLKNGELNCEIGPARVNKKDGWEEWWRDGRLHREHGPAVKNRDGETYFMAGEKLSTYEFVKQNAFKTVMSGRRENGTFNYQMWFEGDHLAVELFDGSECLFKIPDNVRGEVKKTCLNNAMLHTVAAMSTGEVLNYNRSAPEFIKKGTVLKQVWDLYFGSTITGSGRSFKTEPDGSFLLQLKGEDGKITPVYLLDYPNKKFKVFTPDAMIVQDLAGKDKLFKINLAGSPEKGTKTRGDKMTSENGEGRLSTIGSGVSTGIKKGAVKVVSSKAAKYVAEHLPMNDKLPMEQIAQLALLNLGAEVIERAPDGAASKVGLTKERRDAAGLMIRTTSGEILGRNLMGLFGKLAPMLLDGVSALTDKDIVESIGESVEEDENVSVAKEAD